MPLLHVSFLEFEAQVDQFERPDKVSLRGQVLHFFYSSALSVTSDGLKIFWIL